MNLQSKYLEAKYARQKTFRSANALPQATKMPIIPVERSRFNPVPGPPGTFIQPDST